MYTNEKTGSTLIQMKNYKHYFSITLLTIVCAIVGGFIYSQTGVAKTNDKKIAEVAVTTELLSYESANFKYKQIALGETPPANFETSNFDDSSWSVGQAAFGDGGCAATTTHTFWSANTALLVRKKLILPNGTTNIQVRASIDNDVQRIFFNGTEITGFNQSDGCPSIDRFSFNVPQNLVQAGENTVVYQVSDRGGSAFFDTRIFADVPETTCSIPPSGLVSWWKGEGNAIDSFGTNNGTLENGATFASGKVGQAFSFNGNSSVSVPNNASLNPQTFTIAGWVNPAALDNASDVDIIVNKEADNPSTQYEIGISKGTGSIPRGNFAFALGGIGGLPGEGSGWTNGGGSVPINTWTFVTLTFDGTNAKTYLNGVLARDVGNLNGSLITSTGPFRIGDRTAPNSLQTGFNGLIDEVDFYNRALSNTEIQAIYNAGSAGKCLMSCAPPPSGISAWYKSEGNANDSFGSNNGILQNGATFAPGKVGQAFSFDGVDDYIALPNNLLPYPNGGANIPFSFETWFKTSSGGVILAEQIFSPFQSGNGHVPIIYVGTDGKLYSQMFWDGAVHPVASQTTVNDNNYHHVAISYDGAIQRFYLDGNLFGSLTSSQATYSSVLKYQLGTGYTGGAWVGGNGGWFNFNGQIDEATLYNRSLNLTEIQSIFNAGSAGKCQTLNSVYCQNFEGNVGSEWSTQQTSVTPIGNRKFLGEFGNNTATLSLNSLPSHSQVEVSFDIFVLRSWDGNGSYGEIFNLTAQPNQTILNTTFSSQAANNRQSYPENYPGGDFPALTGAIEHNTLGYLFNGSAEDSVYHITKTFSHTGNTIQLDFSGINLEDLGNESWGIDNVCIRLNSQATLSSLSLNPTSVNSGQTSTGTITLVNPAPSGGRTINLTSSDTTTATVPASITIPEGQISGTFTVSTTSVTSDTPVTISAVYQGETRTATLNVLAPKPDLQSVIVNAPAASNTDAAFNLSWTDRNNGSGAASGSWTDKVYISADNQIGNDTLLGDFSFTGTIAPNQNINRIQSITIPNSAVPTSGNYYLIVVTDANNDINEGTNENNNSSTRIINVSRTPLPDLTIDNITAPDTAFFGQTIRVQWTVKNIGNGPTNAAEWQDWYYLSSDDLPELQDPFKAPLQNISYLAAGESYTASADVNIPIGLIGSYKILVYTDSNGRNFPGNIFSVRESNENNNWNIARPIQINAPPLPDLQTTIVQAQEEAFAGQAFNLNWRVENRGDGTTPPNVTAWNDKIYLSQNTTFEPNVDRLIGSRPHNGALPTTQGYSVNSFSVTLPNDIAGNWYVFVVADGDNQIFEFGNENNNSNYDREQPGSPMLIRATPPDLIIPNVISAPNNGNAAGQITVGWTVQNQGAFDAAPNWFDTIYLSSDATLDTATDTPLGTIARSNPLGAGLSYNATANVTLPSCISGNYYLFVFADSRKQIFEYDPTFEAEANNFSQAKPITITSSPSDLRVTAVANPVFGVAGQPTSFSWTVANQGTGATLNTVWNDEVYLSPTANFVKANSTRIGAFTHNGALAVGGSYSQTQNIVIPNTAQGNYYVFVLTDANDNIEECGAANNDNSGGSSTIFNVSNSLPDLTVSNFAFANNFIAGQNVNVTWTVTNGGMAAAQNSSWGDSVYFSTNNVLDGNDRKLTDVVVEGGLASSAAYTKNAQVLLPIVAPGSYFLIVKTDNGDNVFEGQGENNNTRTLVLPIDVPPVDLQVAAVNAPANVFSGQSMTIDWTIQNTGNSQTVGANWTDAVVLSLDQIDDPTDRVIGYLQHEGALGGGASYTAATDVAVPSGLAGQYYIFIRADRNNQLAESNENNNSSIPKPVSLQFAPPSDLIVTNVIQPAAASPGESATFNWTVQNIGANPATGLWTDTVYLSTDQTWDIGDVLVGRYAAGVNVAPGQTYNGTLSTALPAVNLGNYYVIIRTDIRNRVIETNENNNTGASGGTTTVDVPILQLGVPQSTTLVTGQERFYKFNAPADETVRVSLDGQDGSSNELYTRFGQMASRNAYDFLFDRLYEPDQQLLIPNTNAGTYYNMIRGENVPNSLANNEVKQVGKLNTKPIDSKQTTTAENVTVKAEIVPFSITSVSPNRIGDNGQVTITLKGAKFAEGATVKLVQGNNVLNASKIILVDSATVKARFFFNNAIHGVYNVVLTNPNSQFVILTNGITIETATPLKTVYNSTGDLSHIVGRPFTNYSSVTNTSNVDAPYVVVMAYCAQYVRIGWNRPQETLPKQSTIPDADWKNDSPTTKFSNGVTIDGFVIRNMEPNQSIDFSVRLRYLPFGKNQFFINTKAFSLETFLQLQKNYAELMRQFFLNNPQLPISAYLLENINNEDLWWSVFKNGYIKMGLFDSEFGQEFLLSDKTQCFLCLAGSSIAAVGCTTATSGIGFFGCLTGAGIAYTLCAGNSICNSPDPDPGPDPQPNPNPPPPPPPPPNCTTAFANGLSEADCQPPPPPPPDCTANIVNFGSGAEGCNDGHAPSDPNEKMGLIGFGTEKFISKQIPLPYTIDFENVPIATAAAQRVRVTDQLDSNVDPRTFRLKEIGFGSYRLQVPENRAFFGQRVQLGAEFNNLLADISAGVDVSTGKVTWTLTAIDPATGEQPNSANLGLLAPNDETGRGQGFVTYTVQPKQNAPTGTVIRNNATIIFDTEEPITTNTVTNTLDADIPTSAVNALPPTQSTTTFTVSWAGTDLPNGSGLQNYDVWVAENDGAYQPFVSGTTDLNAEFTGILGKTYRFYSIARDNAGNVEAAPNAPDATTRILSPTAANVTVSGRVSDSSGGGISRARITMTAPNGTTRTVTTNTFGFYRFDEVPAGGTYIFNIQHSRYRFDPATRIVSVIDEIQDIDFQAISR